jgi:hypothetical protein
MRYSLCQYDKNEKHNDDKHFVSLAIDQASIAEKFQRHYPDHEWAGAC